jgi:hypothetical protein
VLWLKKTVSQYSAWQDGLSLDTIPEAAGHFAADHRNQLIGECCSTSGKR